MWFILIEIKDEDEDENEGWKNFKIHLYKGTYKI